MHELSFAEQILKVVARAARENGGRRVARVALKVGKLSGVNEESLRFCLVAIASGTIMDGARIEVIETEPELVCRDCGRFPITRPAAPVCPACGRPVDVSPAMDVYVEEIELHDEEDPAGKED